MFMYNTDQKLIPDAFLTEQKNIYLLKTGKKGN